MSAGQEATTGRPRKHAMPRRGQRFGSVRITGEIRPEKWARRDRRFAYRCDCGIAGAAYEFNLRRRTGVCRHVRKAGAR
jgi:hypothetical protein